MAERFKAPVLKTGVGASSPWVRIPLPPPAPSLRLIEPSLSLLKAIILQPHLVIELVVRPDPALRQLCREMAQEYIEAFEVSILIWP